MLETNAVHVMCIERSLQLVKAVSNISMIVPLALVSTQRMSSIQKMLEHNRTVWYANFAWRPAKLFDTVNRALTIFSACFEDNPKCLTTKYQKWLSATRDSLMECISYTHVPSDRTVFWVPKLGSDIEIGLLEKIKSVDSSIGRYYREFGCNVFYRTTGGLYWKVFTNFAPAFKINGKKGHSSRETFFTVESEREAKAIIACLSSDIFWWWYTITSNLRDLNPYDIKNFPIPTLAISSMDIYSLGELYLNDLIANSRKLVRVQKQTGKIETQSFIVNKSKSIINQIDEVLACHFCFTEEELDFIVNYDVKYRMGQDDVEED